MEREFLALKTAAAINQNVAQNTMQQDAVEYVAALVLRALAQWERKVAGEKKE